MLGGLDLHTIAVAVRRALNGILGASGSDGDVLLRSSGAAAGSAFLRFPYAGANIINGKIARTVAGSAITFALKTLDDNDPTPANPVFVRVPTVTGGVMDGGYVIRSVVASLAVVVSSGSTLGHQSAVASAVYVYAIDNAGAIELAVSSKFFGGASVQSSTAEGGAGAADSKAILYSTGARVSVAAVCLQRWKSTQATAGTWAATTGEVQLYPFPFKAPKTTTITATGTFTQDWDTLWASLYCKGGGGSGGGSSVATARGAGGGEGAEGWRIVDQSLIPPSFTVTIGAGGAAVSANTNASGNAGVATGIGTLMDASSGNGGASGNVGGSPGLGGVGATSSNYTMPGATGQPGTDTGGAVVALFGAGGGKGGGNNAVANGVANSGGGGSGGSTAAASGTGGSGIAVIIEHYMEGA